MKTAIFSRKPYLVEAVQVTTENIVYVADWCEGKAWINPIGDPRPDYVEVPVKNPPTPRLGKAFYDDWVLRSISSGGFKVYTPGAFEKGWEEMDEVELTNVHPDQGTFLEEIAVGPNELTIRAMVDIPRQYALSEDLEKTFIPLAYTPDGAVARTIDDLRAAEEERYRAIAEGSI